jgi:hypothetical protein
LLGKFNLAFAYEFPLPSADAGVDGSTSGKNRDCLDNGCVLKWTIDANVLSMER